MGKDGVAMTADIVIIGGGIVGISIAYCLGLRKPRTSRVVLLEKMALCSGSTSKSIGFIHLQHPTRAEIELIQRTLSMIRALDERAQSRLDFNKIGFIHFCQGDDDAERLKPDFILIWKSFPSGDFLEIKPKYSPLPFREKSR